MANNRSERSEPIQVAAGDQYEIKHFAQKHGISMEEARQIIRDAGSSRFKADAAAEHLKNNR
jgi:hypothetical protein